ncbi:MAG: hypothetical protein P0119_08710 [Nitrospira sp.]|nr:hypothetical protein [Nitrospira sp.]
MAVSTATAVRPLAFGPSQGWSDGFPGNGSNARYLHRARPLLDLRRARLLQDLQVPPIASSASQASSPTASCNDMLPERSSTLNRIGDVGIKH